jgi:inhibitor of cysteine peptidase
MAQTRGDGDTKVTLAADGGLYKTSAAGYRGFLKDSSGEYLMLRQSPHRIVALFVATLGLVLFEAHGKTLLLDDSDDNSHLCLYVGDTLTIKLASNPTTGYSWGQLDGAAHLQMLSAEGEHRSADRVGAPGFQTFSLKATEAGNATVTLNYFRPFEKDKPAAKIFLVFVTIEPRPFVTKEAPPAP